jgi:hypothetical protein
MPGGLKKQAQKMKRKRKRKLCQRLYVLDVAALDFALCVAHFDKVSVKYLDYCDCFACVPAADFDALAPYFDCSHVKHLLNIIV